MVLGLQRQTSAVDAVVAGPVVGLFPRTCVRERRDFQTERLVPSMYSVQFLCNGKCLSDVEFLSKHSCTPSLAAGGGGGWPTHGGKPHSDMLKSNLYLFVPV